MNKSFSIIYKSYLERNNNEFILKKPLDLKRLVIHLSEFCKSKSPSYIYSGTEKIPFGEKHPDYQSILKKEFS